MRRFGIFFLGLLASCGPKPPVRTALLGNLQQLKRDIASAQHDGRLGHSAVVSLAQAVGEREVMSAQGASGALRVRGMRPCAYELRHTIEQRAEAEDEVAAELALMLIEMHLGDRAALIQRGMRSPSGAWRAVAARALVRANETDQRRRFFNDPDERVRRAVFAAAREAREATELGELLEAARLDPDPQSKALAASAAGAIGGERAVLALKDIWTRANDSERMGIVDAWAEPSSLVSGGERELALAAEARGGLAPLSALLALTRVPGPQSVEANARLRYYMTNGSDDERRLALTSAPLDDANAEAIAEAAKTANPELRVIALARLSGTAKYRQQSLIDLRLLANSPPTSEIERRARGAAISALARAGDSSVRPALLSNLTDPDRLVRLHAALGLLSLADYQDAARALGDDDADLRSQVACTVLAQETSH